MEEDTETSSKSLFHCGFKSHTVYSRGDSSIGLERRCANVCKIQVRILFSPPFCIASPWKRDCPNAKIGRQRYEFIFQIVLYIHNKSWDSFLMDDITIKIHKKGNARWLKNKLRKEKQRANRPRTQDCRYGCGGQASWCSCCEVYTSTCCVDYGTCMCSWFLGR